jgi:uncharacterized DUF497 family protein
LATHGGDHIGSYNDILSALMNVFWSAARLSSGLGFHCLRQRRILVLVKYVFDPAKDAINQAKHGVSFALAEILFAGPHATTTDDRFDYGEVRQIAFGLINGRLFMCVYVDRGQERRLISLRKANRREATRYAETHQ